MTIRTRVRTPTRIDAPSCPTTRDLRTDRKRTVDPACWPASNPCCLAEMASQACAKQQGFRSEEHTSELQSLMRISYAVFCLKKKTLIHNIRKQNNTR